MTIQKYIKMRLVEKTSYEVADELGVSVPMVSSYKTQGYNPSVKVATRVYQNDGTVLLPFSEEGLKNELRKAEQ